MYLEYCNRITSHRCYSDVKNILWAFMLPGERHGRDRMVIGFSAISAYDH
jgi:hypothetical protein